MEQVTFKFAFVLLISEEETSIACDVTW